MRYGERVSPVVNTHHPPSADSPSSVDNHLGRVVSTSLLVTAAVLLLTAAHNAQKPFRRRRLCAIRRRRAIALLDQRTSVLENTRRVSQGNDRSDNPCSRGSTHARRPRIHSIGAVGWSCRSLSSSSALLRGTDGPCAPPCYRAVRVVVRGPGRGAAGPPHTRLHAAHRRCTYCFLACAAPAQISILVLVPHLVGCPSLTLLVYRRCRSRCSSVVAAPPVGFCVHAGEGRRLSVLRGSCALWCPWTTIRTI
ncbi:hypothetical protein BJ912DRAFT_986960 [Pholiota molesta]|nr:hypothetical protein BJ912DRAFT_986960 [Pholiota molesta]